MFPSLPTTTEALKTVEEHLKEHRQDINLFGLEISHVITILKFMLENIIVKANGKVYRQLRGVGTGYHSSVGYGEIILDKTLRDCIDDNTPIEGISVYVDDSWALWHGSSQELQQFLDILNSRWPGLRFVLTEELGDCSIDFLDLRITRQQSALITTFYRKSTHSGSYLHFTSHCPMIQKINIVRNETRRIIGNCTHRADADPHLAQLRINLLKSGIRISRSLYSETDEDC